MTSVIVADTSVIINGYLADQIESGSIRNSEDYNSPSCI